MTLDVRSHSILRYILDAECVQPDGEPARLPPLGQLAQEMGVSRGKLREELIAAQAFGVIEMRPGDGTYVCPFDFYTAIRPLVLYGIASDRRTFDSYYRLRVQLEVAFWEPAVSKLEETDLQALEGILDRAEHKLLGARIEIPHREHRDFHMLIYSRLENPFASGLLKAYWDAYEAVGLHRYFELSYYKRMWSSHRAMVQAIGSGEYGEGRRVLTQHFTLLEDRLQDGYHRQ